MRWVQHSLFLCSTVLAVLAGGTPFILQSAAQINTSGNAPAVDSGNVSSGDTHSYTLSGTVVNSVTGEPVRRALVRLSSMSATLDSGEQTAADNGQSSSSSESDSRADTSPIERFALTDRAGRFRFQGLPSMHASVSATKPGFFGSHELHVLRAAGSFVEQGTETQIQNAGPGRETVVEVGPNPPAPILKLVPEAVIFGRVVDGMGDPLDDVTIKLSGLQNSNGHASLQTFEQGPEQTQNLRTNENGEFRISGLIPGTYYVAAIPRQNSTRSDSEDVPSQNMLSRNDAPPKIYYPITYYPGAADYSQASPIQLAAGQQAEIDFILKPTRVVLVAGMVTGFLRGEQIDLQFVNQSGDPLSLDKQFDPQSGRFQAHVVAAGTFLVKADTQDQVGHPLYAEAVLAADQDVKSLRLALAPAPSIPITVRREGGNSTGYGQGATPVSLEGSIPAFVTLHPLEIGRPSIAANVEGGPSIPLLVLHNVPAGRYKVEIEASDADWYVRSATYGGVDLLRQELTVTSGQSSAIELVLRNDSATIHGVMQAADSGTGVAVIAIPDYAPLNPRMTNVDDRGEFLLSGLAPGEYKIFAFDQIDGLEYRNPEALGEYMSKAAQVRLQPNEKANLKVDLISRGE